MKLNIVLTVIIFALLIGCKTNHIKNIDTDNEYIRIGDKNADYIPYYLKVYEADSLHLVGDYKQSQHILDSLFKKFEPVNLSFYNEYFTFYRNKMLLNDFDKIDIVLKKLVNNYGFNIGLYLNDSLNNLAMKKAKFTQQDLIGFYDNYVKSLNLEYRYNIEKMIENDQRVRLEVPRNKEEWKKVDAENAETIKFLLAKYGYPNVKKIGRHNFSKKNSNIGTLFLHATKEARESYILDLMWESVKKGECEPTDFATVFDKYLLVTGKYANKVLYGELRDPSQSLDILVVNPKKIDSIRKSIGLEHLNYKRWKFEKITGKAGSK